MSVRTQAGSAPVHPRAGGIVTWIAVLLAAAGAVGWIVQLAQGMGVTGVNQQVVWGLYIAAFFTAAAGAAAALLLVGLSEMGVAILPSRESRARALAVSLASLVAAGLYILFDLGAPERVFKLIFSGATSSLMFWDFWAVVVCFAVALFLILTPAGERRPVLGLVAVLAGVVLILIEARIPGALPARPLWHSSGTVFTWLAGSLLVGFVLLAMIDSQNAPATADTLRTGVVLILATLLLFRLSGILTLTAGTAGGEEAALIRGTFAGWNWLGVVVGLVVPLVLLLRPRVGRVPMQVALWMALIGLVMDKIAILGAGTAVSVFEPVAASYGVSPIEVLTALGPIGVGLLVYRWLAKLVAR